MFMPRFEAIPLALHALKEAVPATYLSPRPSLRKSAGLMIPR
jgi:hypothetical protein